MGMPESALYIPLLHEFYPARVKRALGLLLADGAPKPTVGGRGDFLARRLFFFLRKGLFSETKSQKIDPKL